MWAGWREDPKMADMRGSPRGSRDRETDTEERGPRVRSCQDSRRLGQAKADRWPNPGVREGFSGQSGWTDSVTDAAGH